MKKKILLFFGTRPEAIKMAPVVTALRRCREFAVKVAVSAQHRELLDDVLENFGIIPDHDLEVMTENQSLFDVTTRVLSRFEPVLKKEKPDMILVHGDTTTTLGGSLAGCYLKIPVGHVEAGLRTYNKRQPFPEEINRQLTDKLSDLHFAPTAESARNLLRERTPAESIFITGNTVIDALLWTAARPRPIEDERTKRTLANLKGGRLILVTAHRRENFGGPFREAFQAIKELSTRFQDVLWIYPVHPNPNVRRAAREELGKLPRVILTAPVSYTDLVALLKKSTLVLTDSGGLQEEAPSLGKPVLVLRNVTERPEAVRAGTVRMVGTNRGRIIREISALLTDKKHYRRMAAATNPYGDGKAAGRTVEMIRYYFGFRKSRPPEFK
jgi:UDP-N-acetylglucosamine 2-epimerase (non-hydrolysing)